MSRVIKQYVAVDAHFTEEGRIFEVDRIIDVRPAASLKAGGAGIRYTISVLGKETYGGKSLVCRGKILANPKLELAFHMLF